MVKKGITGIGFILMIFFITTLGSVNASYFEPCLDDVYEERLPRPSGAITSDGKYIEYDYTGLPDPEDMIFACVDGELLKTDVPVQIERGYSLVPMRSLLTELGASIEWDNKSQTVVSKLADKTIKIQVNNSSATVNGKKVKLDTPARLKQGRVFIPLRFVSEQLGAQVVWQPDQKLIKILTHPEISVKTLKSYGSQIYTDDYLYNNFFKVSERFLLKNNNSIYLLEDRVEALYIQQFDLNFNKIKAFTLKNELDKFGGAHVGDDGHLYIVYGQWNESESDEIPVYRVVKYDQDWNKVKQLDIKDVNVAVPFDASNLTMDSQNNKLIIHSARERYMWIDGLNHQSNISFLINTNDMTLMNDISDFPDNHVSHSFATYTRFDGERIVYADHGDAYPRAIVIQTEEQGEIKSSINVMSFPGEIGDNYTGAHLGGLEVAKDNYLLVGSSVDLDEKNYGKSTTKNLFLSIIPKDSMGIEDIQTEWLTKHSVNSDVRIKETHIVKVNDNKFVLFWSEQVSNKAYLYYSIIDGKGATIEKPTKLEGVPSPGNMQPLFHNNSIIWYSAHYDLNQIELFQLDVR